MTTTSIDIEPNDRRDSYVASSGQTVFDYTFPIYDTDEITVAQNGTILTLTSDYTVQDAGEEAGGTITLVTGATLDDEIVIYGSSIIKRQDQNFQQAGDFYSTDLNRQLNKLTIFSQELQTQLDRKFGISSESTYSGSSTLPDAEAGKLIGWNLAADGLENKDPDSGGIFPSAPDSYVKSNSSGIYESKTPAQVGADVIATQDTDALTEGSTNLYDKTVVLTAGTDISVTGTYPNFTIASTVSSDYPAGYIKGGVASNTEITDEFVSMTSNTTPSGEECWATSQYSSSYAPWYAFNKTTASTDDAWVAGATGTQILLRAMTSANPLNVLSITSRTNGEHPIDFTLVYTEDDMSGYSNVDTGLSSISFTTVRTLTSQSFTAGETKYYDLDSAVPVTATAYGIIVTSFSGACSIGRLDGYSGIYNGVTLTSLKARSSDDTTDLNISAGSLDKTSASSWKSGVVPTLTSTTIHIFADNNSGSQQFIFDVSSSLDSKLLPIPTNITDSYRYCFSIITNSSGNIIAFKCYEKSGGAIVIHYNNRITDYSSNAAYNGLMSISVPNGVLVSPIINYAVESANTNNCSLTSSLNEGNSITVAYQIGSGEGNVAAISEGLQTTTAQVRYYQYAVSNTTNIYNNGYTIER